MTVPLSASEQVLTAIGNISSFMTVHSAIAADNVSNRPGNITFADSDSTTYIHLIPYGTGFRLEMFVKPFIDGGHYSVLFSIWQSIWNRKMIGNGICRILTTASRH